MDNQSNMKYIMWYWSGKKYTVVSCLNNSWIHFTYWPTNLPCLYHNALCKFFWTRAGRIFCRISDKLYEYAKHENFGSSSKQILENVYVIPWTNPISTEVRALTLVNFFAFPSTRWTTPNKLIFAFEIGAQAAFEGASVRLSLLLRL